MLGLSRSAFQAAPRKVVFPTALTLCPPPPSDPWLGDKLTVFHQKGVVSLVLLVMREVEGDGEISAKSLYVCTYVHNNCDTFVCGLGIIF